MTSAKTPWLIAAALACVIVYLLAIASHPLFRITADPPGILREVRQLKELVTVRYSIQKVAGLREDKVPFGSESILLIVQAKVLGGVDLASLTDRDVRIDGSRKAAIHLPAPSILHVYLDEKDTKVWDRTKTWWTPWVPYDIDLEKKARLAAIDSVTHEALDMGILKDARENAEAVIRSFLRPLGIEQVAFTW